MFIAYAVSPRIALEPREGLNQYGLNVEYRASMLGSSFRKSAGFMLVLMSVFVVLPLCSNVHVAHAVLSPGVWYLLDGLTPDAMDLTSYSNVALLAARGMDNSIWYRAMDSSGIWMPWVRIPGFTDARPAIAVFNSRLFFVCKGAGTNNIWFGSVLLSTGVFSGWTMLAGPTPSSVSLAYSATSGNYLYLAARGMDDSIWVRRMDAAETWSSWVKIPGLTDVAPEIVVFTTYLLICCKQTGASSIWEGRIDIPGFTTWTGWVQVAGLTPSSVSLVRTGEQLPTRSMAARGMENGIWYHFYTGAGWGPWIRLPGYTDVAPAIGLASGSYIFLVCKEYASNRIWFLVPSQ